MTLLLFPESAPQRILSCLRGGIVLISLAVQSTIPLPLQLNGC